MKFRKTRHTLRLVTVSGLGAALSVSGAGCTAQTGSDSEVQREPQNSQSAAIVTATASFVLGPTTQFFVPSPSPSAVHQIVHLLEHGDVEAGLDVLAMVAQGHASWFHGGTPREVRESTAQTMSEAAFEHRIPVLVPYNVPFRDCANYSAGGAADTASYESWIDGFAAGIGHRAAVVILEPDSLGLIPYNTTIYGVAEPCQPTVTDASGNVVPAPGADPTDRYAQLAYALVTLANKAPDARVYVDGTHSAWLGVGESAYRINHLTTVASQVAAASAMPFHAAAVGFFLNVSNYQPTDPSTQYGTWVSDCITAATAGAPWAAGHFDWCPSQYDPALNYAVDYSAAYEATVTAGLQNMMGGAAATTHFVIDTGRNGQGTLNTALYAAPPYNQSPAVIAALGTGAWCNAASAGVGLRPSANTGVPLLDAYLWIKIPGQSDGTCDIAGGARAWDFSLYDSWAITGAAQNSFDPLWGMVDPVAGDWFPAMALGLAQKASPAF
jgi:endoglucanase